MPPCPRCPARRDAAALPLPASGPRTCPSRTADEMVPRPSRPAVRGQRWSRLQVVLPPCTSTAWCWWLRSCCCRRRRRCRLCYRCCPHRRRRRCCCRFCPREGRRRPGAPALAERPAGACPRSSAPPPPPRRPPPRREAPWRRRASRSAARPAPAPTSSARDGRPRRPQLPGSCQRRRRRSLAPSTPPPRGRRRGAPGAGAERGPVVHCTRRAGCWRCPRRGATPAPQPCNREPLARRWHVPRAGAPGVATDAAPSTASL
mmetsp:Transcript_31558/g.93937  ORF Transcript_31558/g.93937 Transcript_31558/m.93937 type:complete len:260 (-) Transcript_31558:349-1128(-)